MGWISDRHARTGVSLGPGGLKPHVSNGECGHDSVADACAALDAQAAAPAPAAQPATETAKRSWHPRFDIVVERALAYDCATCGAKTFEACSGQGGFPHASRMELLRAGTTPRKEGP